MRKFLIILSLLCIINVPAFANPGDVAGNVYYTDIQAYLYNAPVTSYNIGGRTVIDGEILNWHYGFEVYWYGDKRVLSINDMGGRFNSIEALGGTFANLPSKTPGRIAGKYYETDIITILDERVIEAYNIGGRTFIVAEEMAKHGYNVVWDPDERTITIDKPMDFYKAETDYGTIKSLDNYSSTEFLQISERGATADGKTAFGGDEQIILKGNFACNGYIKLSEFEKLFNCKAELIETVEETVDTLADGRVFKNNKYVYTISIDTSGCTVPDSSEFMTV